MATDETKEEDTRTESQKSRDAALRMDLGWNDGENTTERIVAAGLGGIINAIVYVGDAIRESSDRR